MTRDTLGFATFPTDREIRAGLDRAHRARSAAFADGARMLGGALGDLMAALLAALLAALQRPLLTVARPGLGRRGAAASPC